VTDASAHADSRHDAVERFDALLARARTVIRVETRRNDRVVAATTITLAGDTHTTIAVTIIADDFERHCEAVVGELRARTARLRTLSAVVQAATRIAIATGTGNPLLALHAALRLVSELNDGAGPIGDTP
jgi:hypothetical protein